MPIPQRKGTNVPRTAVDLTGGISNSFRGSSNGRVRNNFQTSKPNRPQGKPLKEATPLPKGTPQTAVRPVTKPGVPPDLGGGELIRQEKELNNPTPQRPIQQRPPLDQARPVIGGQPIGGGGASTQALIPLGNGYSYTDGSRQNVIGPDGVVIPANEYQQRQQPLATSGGRVPGIGGVRV